MFVTEKELGKASANEILKADKNCVKSQSPDVVIATKVVIDAAASNVEQTVPVPEIHDVKSDLGGSVPQEHKEPHSTLDKLTMDEDEILDTESNHALELPESRDPRNALEKLTMDEGDKV